MGDCGRFQRYPTLHTLQCDRSGFVSGDSQAHNDVQRWPDCEFSLATISSFRACMREQLTHVKSVKQLANLLIVDNQCISSNFGEVCTALVLFLTLPVTVATAERSFSKLKLIKSYLRSTINQERLSGLAIFQLKMLEPLSLTKKTWLKNSLPKKKSEKWNFNRIVQFRIMFESETF